MLRRLELSKPSIDVKKLAEHFEEQEELLHRISKAGAVFPGRTTKHGLPSSQRQAHSAPAEWRNPNDNVSTLVQPKHLVCHPVWLSGCSPCLSCQSCQSVASMTRSRHPPAQGSQCSHAPRLSTCPFCHPLCPAAPTP